jgi:short subunit dehydrogenase-like uncharacterized protein
LNSGTVATARAVWDRPDDVEAMADPHLLSPGRPSPAERRRDADPVLPVFDPDLGRWVGPFWTGPINTRVVRRSRELERARGADYGRGFRYQEFWDPGGAAPLLAAGTVAWGMASYRCFSRVPRSAEWLAPLIPVGDELPSESVDDGCYYRALFVGTGEDGSRCWVRVADRGDPSNQATVRIVCECALALALDGESLPGGARRGGVLTPASGLGLPLVRRLRRRGVALGRVR